MLLGFPRHALLLILDNAFMWNFESEEFRFTASCHFLFFESVYKLVHSLLCSLEYHAGVCNESSYATRNCLHCDFSLRILILRMLSLW